MDFAGRLTDDSLSFTVGCEEKLPLTTSPPGVLGVTTARGLFRRLITLSPISRYAVAVGAAVAAVGIRLSFDPAWGIRLPFITMFPAVALSAWLGGFWPGLVTTVICAASAQYLWLPPAYSWAIADPRDVIGLVLFVTIGAVICALNEAWRRGAAAAERGARLLETIADGIFEADPDHRITSWNQAAERMYGYTAPEAIGRKTFELLRSAVSPEQRTEYVKRTEAGEILRIEVELRRKDGSPVWVDMVAIANKRSDGTLAGFISVNRDISTRKRAESELRARTEELERVLDMIPAAVWIANDPECREVFANRAAAALLALPQQTNISQTPAAGAAEPPRMRHVRDGRELSPQELPMQVAAATGLAQQIDEMDIELPDGKRLTLVGGAMPLLNEAGRVRGVVSAFSDITYRKEIERQRADVLVREQAARTDLERAGRLKDEFLAVLSHELRTPLNAVLGYAHLLAAGTLSPDRTAHALAAIQRNAKAQARLVESLLDLSRVMAGKLELNLERVNLAAIVDAAVDVVRPEAEEQGITLHVLLPSPDPIVLVGDAGRLQQVFWNLLSNAMKFTPAGGTISIAVHVHEEHVEIRGTDNGQGIRPDFLPYVFERFKQADSQKGRRSAGLGLGLALVREMVQAHGGTVGAESEGDGYGSSFRVTLPLSLVPGHSVASPSAAPRDSFLASLAALDVLIVDDDGDVRDVLTLLLASHGAAVRAVASTAEALDAIHMSSPDLLLADIGLPDEDGYSLIRKIRTRERERNAARLPAIAVSAYATLADREQASAAGYDGHVPKPIDADVLALAIAKVVALENA